MLEVTEARPGPQTLMPALCLTSGICGAQDTRLLGGARLLKREHVQGLQSG